MGDTRAGNFSVMQNKKYYRLILGAKSLHVVECLNGNYIGVDFGIKQDLTNELPEKWQDLNKNFVPFFFKTTPAKQK